MTGEKPTDSPAYQAGIAAGSKWVGDERFGAYARAVGRLAETWKGRDKLFGRMTTRSKAQRVHAAIFPYGDPNHAGAEEFWDSWAGPDAVLSQTFLEGFMAGALEAWAEVGHLPSPDRDRRAAAEEKAEFACGEESGRDWAEEMARTNSECVPLVGVFLEKGADDDFFRADLSTSAFSRAELLFFLISPDDEGDREAARTFWRQETKNENPPDNYLKGFVKGAMKVENGNEK